MKSFDLNLVNQISIKNEIENKNQENKKYITAPFYSGGLPLNYENEKHAKWGMTLLKAGSMRFRWNENNENRNKTLKEVLKELKEPVCTGNCSSDEGKCDCKLISVPIELIHSKIIFEAKNESDTRNLQGDGIICQNPLLVPTITIADCLPIFLYDKKNKAIGAFHSGWKGTGIAAEGVEKFVEKYSSERENICAAIGPHIGECCYYVDEERADYFIKNFGAKCISKSENHNDKFKFKLSLTKANLFLLKNAGIMEENIVVANDCTCCEKFTNGENIFGSFRREAAFLAGKSSEEKSRSMTVQAGFIYLP